MKRLLCALSFLALAGVSGANTHHSPLTTHRSPLTTHDSLLTTHQSVLTDCLEAISAYSGTKVVFDARDLPDGKYHDVMTTLSAERKLRAAQIALREVHKYPKGYLGKVGIKAIGIFDGCASKHDDGYHTYDKSLKGYRYYGIWNGKDGIAAAYYSDTQLPLTLHHEIFHQVDATRNGVTDYDIYFKHDERFKQILEGKKTYDAAPLTRNEVASLDKAAAGHVLESVVGDYCKKSSAEDKAETARWLMSHLPDALLQIHTRPDLPGSQRLMHVLNHYEHAVKNGPALAWFLDRALDHHSPLTHSPLTTPPLTTPPLTKDNPYLDKVNDAIADPALRAAIRKVQPACVRLDRGSGVCVSADGSILTCAHVAGKVGNELHVKFPDGRKFIGTCVALNHKLDLALLKVDSKEKLPFAHLAADPPEEGARIVCIGQPGSVSPSGKPTGYQPFHVSTGHIKGFNGDPLGDQSLGRTMHDAWTYWGHSGSPLFNSKGQIVALHNSWDSKTATRHAVTYQAIKRFLRE